MTLEALGIDVSRYNGLVSWQVAKDNLVVFAGIRASISWGYRDPFGLYNMAECRKAGIFQLPYHVLYPGENAIRQADNYLAITEDWTGAAPVLDLELDHNYSRITITTCAIAWCERVKQVTGKDPIVYSRAGWINEHTTTGAWRNEYDWWLADYLGDRTQEQEEPPIKPTGVNTWLIHQTADKITAWPGLNGPGGISTVDYNRWNGDAIAVGDYFGANPPEGVIICPRCGHGWIPNE